VEAHARAKVVKKGCDWIVANDVSRDVMGGVENEVLLIRRDGAEHWPRMAKEAVATRLAKAIADELTEEGRLAHAADM
jgi:phosphopantothenoylcysteine decarboxylase/phosphopantothenate--cysteine ligase